MFLLPRLEQRQVTGVVLFLKMMITLHEAFIMCKAGNAKLTLIH